MRSSTRYTVKSLYRTDRRDDTIAASTHEQIKVGDMAIRFLLEGEQSAESIAVFEFDVPPARR
jgi:hypothetical protein